MTGHSKLSAAVFFMAILGGCGIDYAQQGSLGDDTTAEAESGNILTLAEDAPDILGPATTNTENENTVATEGDDAGAPTVDDNFGEPDNDTTEVNQVSNLTSGIYRYSYNVIEDPCGWVDIMNMNGGDFTEYLPTTFRVEGGAGEFNIRAIDYGGPSGTPGSVLCPLSGASFDCETQQVTLLDTFLGTNGFSWEVDFSGEVVNSESVRGRADVRFVSAGAYFGGMLESAGINIADCSQSLSMTLFRASDLRD